MSKNFEKRIFRIMVGITALALLLIIANAAATPYEPEKAAGFEVVLAIGILLAAYTSIWQP